jgi:hypothetical protein
MRKVVIAVVLMGVLCGPAQALAKVEALDPAGAGSPALAGKALMADGSLLSGAALPERPFGASSANSSIGLGQSGAPAPESLAGFPTAGDDYAILSTGEIGTVASQFSAGYLGSTQFPSQTSPEPTARGVARDWTVLKLDVDVPAGANCLAFDFRFLSEEYPQYVGSTYNDAFVAEVDANSWSVLSGGALVRPNDFAASPLGEPISVNGVGPTEMVAAEAGGTYFNAATHLLTARTLITPGAHSVYLSIFDASDKKYDSAVLLDNLRFVKLAPIACRPLTTQPKVPLVVAKGGAGGGEVTSSPAGIACGLDCEEEYEPGQIVDLAAVAAPDSEFSGWSGGGCTGTGSCETTVSEAEEVTATFDPLPPPEPPGLTATSPASPANDTTPLVIGSAPAGTTVSLYASEDCSGTPVAAAATPAELAAGIEVAVAANAVTQFSATTSSASPSPSACSNSISYMEDSTTPSATIEGKPASPSASTAASFAFAATDPDGSGVAGFECKLDDGAFAACTSPKTYGSLADGSHRFAVRAIDVAGNVEADPPFYRWTVDTSVPAAPAVAPLVLGGLVPVNGESVAVAPESGQVLVKRPGQGKFAPLQEGQTIPVGSVVDTTAGKASLTSINPVGEEQTALFYSGRFLVAQHEGSGLVNLRLRGGSFSACAGSSRRRQASASGRGGRRLWGSGKGNFRTEGSYGSATVRGTIWFTEDRCNGTYFEVKRGVVSVRDFAAGKTLLLPAGKSYLTGSG